MDIPRIYLNVKKNLKCPLLLYNSKCKLNMSECPLCHFEQHRQCSMGKVYVEEVCKEYLQINYNGKIKITECLYAERFDGVNIYGSIHYGDYDRLYDEVNRSGNILLSKTRNIIVPEEQNAILLDKIERSKYGRIFKNYKTNDKDIKTDFFD